MYPEFGALSAVALDRMKALSKAMGYEMVGSVKPKWGGSDFSAEIASLRASAASADFIFNVSAQLDQAYFMKQFQVSGINKPIFGIEYVGSPAKVAGAAYNGMYFAQDDFNAADPVSPWAKLFVKDYRATYGDDGFPQATPDFYPAGYYEATFAMWELFRRVKAKGGNVNDGAQLLAALEAKPSFPSVFGGTSSAVGRVEFDKVTHGLKHRPVGLYQVRKLSPVRLATSDLRGRGFKLVAK
jgi:ABC-type branched-subunit amino acid transport system substrate-binding protein